MKRRIDLLDLWRSLAIIYMLFYHFWFDLGLFGIITWKQVFSPVVQFFRLLDCSSFIIVSGISSRLSRSNLKRGFIVLLCAMIVQVVTYFVEIPVYFGILHFLGCAMVMYGIIGERIERIPSYAAPVVFTLLFVITKIWTETASPISMTFLYPFGLTYPEFYSSDYYPVFPWIFMFLLGTWLGGLVEKYCETKWLRTEIPSALTFAGRHSLVIYMLHQPILYTAISLFSKHH